MIDLDGARVFLSASFPSGERGERFRPYDTGAIAEAVTALAQAVLYARGRLVFGAHPTISPLVLLVAVELGRLEVVEIHQSRHFEGQVPKETLDLVERGYGVLSWTEGDRGGDLKTDLRRMRERMLGSERLSAGVFVGGMEGVLEEYELLAEVQPEAPRLRLRAPGGAARRLPIGDDAVALGLAERLGSPQYPALAREIVSALAGRS
jgi:hypothetical protein